MEAQRASQRDESLQTDWTRGVSSFSVESELRRESEAAGNQPVPLLDVKLCSDKTHDVQSGGGGNCTRHSIFGTHCPQFDYVLRAEDAQEMCRDDEALRELVACWHRLTSDVRVRIMEIARAAR